MATSCARISFRARRPSSSCGCAARITGRHRTRSWDDAVTEAGIAQDHAADVDQAFAAWLNVAPPRERDVEADALAEQYFAYVADEPSPARLRKILVGNSVVEIGRFAVTTNS